MGSEGSTMCRCAVHRVGGIGVSTAVIYVDTLLLLAALSFVMDYLLLWATAKVTKVHFAPLRLAGGALVGAAYFVLYYLSERGAIGYYGWLRFWPSVLAASFLMILLAFYPLRVQRFLRVTGYFYVITLTSGGAGIAAGYALGWGVAWRLLVSIAAILLTAELGWGVVQKSLWQRLYQVPLEIVLFGERVVTTALLDTGNRLRDPVSGAPVAVVEHQVIAHLFPEHLEEAIRRMERGDLSEIGRVLSSAQWSARFRVVPYTALGKEKGLLVGFRPDEVWVTVEGKRVHLDRVIVGIYHRRLDPEGAYQALVHPEMIQSALSSEGASLKEYSSRHQEGESTHVTTPS